MKRKQIRTRGKIRFSEYFKELNAGDTVCVKREKGVVSAFPHRIQGNTGIIESKRGREYIVKINDFNQEKRYIISAVHLKKLENKK